MAHPGTSPRIGSAALRALAHPLRVEMYELLRAHGPATATVLGRRLGESSGATSYHLRQLARHGLIEDDPQHSGGRERWWRAVPGGRTLVGYDELSRTGTRAAAEVVLREVVRGRTDRFLRFVQSAGSWDVRWREAATDLEANLRLDPGQLHALVSELSAVVERYRAADPGDGSAAVEVQLVAFPKPDPAERA